jgi:uncharacterized damage-inducible protein DinB
MTAIGTRREAGALADAVREANAEAIKFVEECPPGAWTHRTAEQGWTLSMATAHIAIGHLVIARWLHKISSGQDIAHTLADSETFNASDARYNSELSRSEVVERLRVYGAALELYVRDLSDDQLGSSSMWLGRQWTIAEMVRDVAIGHARGHLAHIVAAADTVPGEERE